MNKIPIILLITLIVGCTSTAKKPPLRDGYKKIFSTKTADTYIVRVHPWHYRNNMDLIQIDTVIALKKVDTVVGKNFQSIRTRYVFDCNEEYKYAKTPSGFYSDLYATGEPIVPYPLPATRWLIAKDNRLDANLWKSFCKLKDYLSQYP